VELSDEEVDEYATRLVALLERFGDVRTKPGVSEPVDLLEADDGSLSFELIGSLPDGREPARSTLELRERFQPITGGRFERDRYAYELVDRERGFRRAFHLHDPDWFERRYLVVVHEHCEQPIRTAGCAHYHGPPIRDGYAGAVTLMDAWTGEPPDCSIVPCFDEADRQMIRG
jgi:hypothetical protein